MVWKLVGAGCGKARRIAATSEAGDGTAGLCAVLSAVMKYSAVDFVFVQNGSFVSGHVRSWFSVSICLLIVSVTPTVFV